MNWDDLRIAIAVNKAGSFAAAAARLKIDETTVSRRLSRLQKDLGVTLFEAVDGTRRPTAQCLEILHHADSMARHAERIATGETGTNGLVGRYRIAATDSVTVEVLGRRLPGFLADNPGFALHFLVSTENVNFSRWEADIAIRLGKPARGDFIISKLADVSLYLFEPLPSETSERADLVVAYPEDLDQTPESRFMIRKDMQGRARCLTKNLLLTKPLIASGHGSGVLPGYMCADLLTHDDLKVTRLDETREVWLLLQSHLKDDPGARMVIDWVRACFSELAGAAP